MKKLIVTGLILALFESYGYAEMGGMPGNRGQGHEMMGNQQGQMMSHSQMTSGMMDVMHQMQGMMGNMESMMKNMSPDKMQRMSKMMMEMSQQMMDVSKMMQKGEVSQKEMDTIDDKMMNLQKGMSEMK